ncbi:3-hydroxyacyl-CoA dehydrogenase [Agromyces atrinae]|uniref:3-hydroxyacyl-CoA dehydrogenase n=1 Tax=Agromyces atrinae TaxID=592376 RepID=A0A852SIA9_9MICO|nr:3-hydroxyacyl-CoA dehydrogenase [Agromyces atrinae]NYD68115.1 3-hydroxyacyl-CoA dehydrogenase [Agromyces atrinae]
MVVGVTDAAGDARPVAIVGAGSIGVAFAVLFARAGRAVRLIDPVDGALDRAAVDVAERLALLDEHGLLAESIAVVTARIGFTADLAAGVAGAVLVQECAPERLDLKRDLVARIGEAADADAVIASSSSAIVPSAIAAELPSSIADRVIVGHPGNPPYLLPVIEVVPTPATRAEAVDLAVDVYRSAGLRTVLVRREVEGFVFNRLQGALLREAYCLVRDGVASADDVDEVVRSGLGLRWSFMGPFETVDLNTRGGIAAHAERMGPAYERMGAERGQRDSWTPDLVARVVAERRDILPLDEWNERVRWRDEQLLRLQALRHETAAPAGKEAT